MIYVKSKRGLRILLLAVFGLVALMSPQLVAADIASLPPTFKFYLISVTSPPFILMLMFINFFINAPVLYAAGHLFIRKIIRKISLDRFVKAVLIMTVLGYIADIAPTFLLGIYTPGFIGHYVSTFALLAFFNLMIARYFLKAPLKRALMVGILIALLTNPHIFWLGNDPQAFRKERIRMGAEVPFNGQWCTNGTINIVIANTGNVELLDENFTSAVIGSENITLGDFAIPVDERHTIQYDCGGTCEAGTYEYRFVVRGSVISSVVECE